MTEAEYLEILSALVSNGIAAYTVFISLVGGYLVAMYNAGQNMTSMQVWIVNGLYLFSVAVVLLLTFGIYERMVVLGLELENMNPNRSFTGDETGPYWIIFLNSIVVLASIIFMWGVRRKSAE